MVFAAQNLFGVFYLISTFSYFVCVLVGSASLYAAFLGEVGKLESGAENCLPLPSSNAYLVLTVSCQHVT